MWSIWSWIVDWINNWILGWITWLFDPVLWLQWALKFVGFLLWLVTLLLPSPLDSAVSGFVEFITGEGPVKLVGFGLWLMSPIIDTAVVMASFRALCGCWIICLCLKFLFWLKGHIWSTSS